MASKTKDATVNMVDNPPHYMQSENETIVEMILIFGWDAAIGYAKCAAWKYRARAPFKGNFEQDEKKTDWYVSIIPVLELRDLVELKKWLKARERNSKKSRRA